MSQLKKLCTWMEKRHVEKCQTVQKENSIGTLLVEQDLDIRNGSLGESMPQKVLIETSKPVLFQIVEGKKAQKGTVVVRGKFGECDTPTANGRIYSRKLMEREIGKLKESMNDRSISMCGTLNHPSDGKTDLKEISHIVTDLSVDDNGDVYGEAEVLGNLPSGKILLELINSGIRVPVSSRGYGSTAPSRGKYQGEEVQDDFVLKTYDFVSDPAVKSAVPSAFFEDINTPDFAKLFLDTFPEVASEIATGVIVEDKEKKGELASEIDGQALEALERKIKDVIVEMKSDVEKSLREEYDGDPEIGGAKGILAAIADMVIGYRSGLDENVENDADKARDLEIADLKTRCEELERDKKLIEQALFLEKKISGHAMSESIRSLIGDKLFESQEELNNAINSIIGNVDSCDFVTKREAELQAENATLNGKIALLESKVDVLNDKVGRAVELGKRVEQQRVNSVNEAEETIQSLKEALDNALEEAAMAQSLKKRLDESEERHAEKLNLERYKFEKVASFRNGRELLSLMESVEDRATVDALVKKKGAVTMKDPMMDNVFESTRGKVEKDAFSIGDSSKSESLLVEDELGVNMEYLKSLSGYNQQ